MQEPGLKDLIDEEGEGGGGLGSEVRQLMFKKVKWN